MVNFLSQFQRDAQQISPAVLAGIGFALTWVGLCLWLGGLRWLRFFAGLTLAIAGYIAGRILFPTQMVHLVLIAIVPACIGVFLDKITMVLLAAGLAALAGLLIFAAPVLGSPDHWKDSPAASPSPQNPADKITHSFNILKTDGLYLIEKIKQSIVRLGSLAYAIAITALLVVVGASFVMSRWICAAACSAVGMAMIALGMLFLLLFKGAAPIDMFAVNPPMYGWIAAAMVIFGILVELALCPTPKKRKPSVPSKGESI